MRTIDKLLPPTLTRLNTGPAPTLAEAQAAVGGLIEIVTLRGGDQLIVNEEGKVYGLAVNPEATGVMIENGIMDVIAGPALLLSGDARLD